MRRFLAVLLLAPALALSVGSAVTAGEGSWMDMGNCEMCKALTEEDPGLIKNMSWEYHDISDGLMSVSTVTPTYREHFRRASKRAEQVQTKLREGKDVKLCNMCIEYGSMLMSGKVKVEHVNTLNGNVDLTTSDDPEMIGRIKKWGERTRTELAKMETEPESKTETMTKAEKK